MYPTRGTEHGPFDHPTTRLMESPGHRARVSKRDAGIILNQSDQIVAAKLRGIGDFDSDHIFARQRAAQDAGFPEQISGAKILHQDDAAIDRKRHFPRAPVDDEEGVTDRFAACDERGAGLVALELGALPDNCGETE